MSEAEKSAGAGTVVLVDDDPSLLRLLALRLESGGFEVETAESAAEALGVVATRMPDVVVTDLRMQGMDGMALFRQLREEQPTLPVIIMTAHGTIPDAVDATREGAFAFLTKPFDSSKLLLAVREAVAASGSRGSESAWRAGIVTRSPVMKKLLDEVELIAQTDASVMIIGESGTGKELLARAVHESSARSKARFVALNCSAVPAELLEAELFGHTRGAFTGAEKAREGLFAHARGGTLFLDEIGDMPLPFQGKLLRAVQERRVRPVGADSEIEIDARLVSATHRDLEQALTQNEFREDLYYRLNVVSLEVPPLRHRREDVPLLANHFLQELTHDLPRSRRISGFSREAIRALVSYHWPGNIRQLRNVVEQAVTLCRKGPIPADLVQRALREESTAMPSLVDARNAFERDYLVRALRLTSGNVREAALLAQRNRTEFYRLLKRHHLDPAAFKAES